jgi:hypothetical protein
MRMTDLLGVAAARHNDEGGCLSRSKCWPSRHGRFCSAAPNSQARSRRQILLLGTHREPEIAA